MIPWGDVGIQDRWQFVGPRHSCLCHELWVYLHWRSSTESISKRNAPAPFFQASNRGWLCLYAILCSISFHTWVLCTGSRAGPIGAAGSPWQLPTSQWIVELIHLGSWLAGSLKPTTNRVTRAPAVEQKTTASSQKWGFRKLVSFIGCRVNPQFSMANLSKSMMPACAQGMSEGTCDLTNARLRQWNVSCQDGQQWNVLKCFMLEATRICNSVWDLHSFCATPSFVANCKGGVTVCKNSVT